MKKSKVNSHISNRVLYTLIALGILLVVGVGVFATSLLPTTGAKSNPGHWINETAPPLGCAAGQVLQWTGVSNGDGGWACASGSSGNLPVCDQGQYLIANGISNGETLWQCAGRNSPTIVKATVNTHNGNFGGWNGISTWIQSNGCEGYHVCSIV